MRLIASVFILSAVVLSNPVQRPDACGKTCQNLKRDEPLFSGNALQDIMHNTDPSPAPASHVFSTADSGLQNAIDSIVRIVADDSVKMGQDGLLADDAASTLGGLTGFRETGARPVKRKQRGPGREKVKTGGSEYGAGLRRKAIKGEQTDYGAGLRRGEEEDTAEHPAEGRRASRVFGKVSRALEHTDS